MLDKLERLKLFFIEKGYRCRDVKDYGFIARGCKGNWRVWINYDGGLVWEGNAGSIRWNTEIESQIKAILSA